MRSIAEKLKSPAPAQLPEAGKRSEDVLSLKLETPMYGGGVVAGEVDTDRPVRVPSVRGNLRFWWRTLFAGDKKGEKLREAENAIWGSTATPSRVSVSVECEPWSRLRKHDAADPFGFKKFGAEAYALFPAAPQRQKGLPGHDILEEKMPFTLRLTYSETLEQDKITEVRAAFAAWVYFGGLGSRTRRGLGTLSCEKADLSGGGKLPGLKELLARNTDITLWTKEPKGAGALDAWHEALELYRIYRQQQRNPGQERNRPGRSHWPEPDSLRKLTKQSDPRHATPITGPLPSFPRAALGLPIIFHFIDKSDPKDVTLKGKPDGSENAAERMSSPVITKALFDGGKWRSAVVILPRKDALAITPVPDTGNTEGIIGVRDSRYIKAPYQPTQGADNAISGFENFIRDKGFKEEVCA